MKKSLSTVILVSLAICMSFSQEMPKYKNSKLPVQERVEDLMSRMTLEEKVEQLQSQLTYMNVYQEGRNYRVGHFRNIAHFMHQGPGGPSDAATCAKAINEDTRKSVEASRWGIPVLQHGEALHGAQWGNATCFPQSIGMAASFDDEFYFKVGQAVAKELRAVGVRQAYAPVVNVTRDPRWGRTEETYGEDVLLNSRMGVAYTKALEQGGVIATLKHFVDNYSDGGRDGFASNSSWRTLHEVYLEPFRACIQEGGARSIMTASNALDGVPCTMNNILLNDVLRKAWGFNGYTVSDYSCIQALHKAHKVAVSYEEAQALSIEVGLDVELPRGYKDLVELVRIGRISEELINQSLRRVLTCKFELGLFETPYVDANKANTIVRSNEHRELALAAARKVMTLLKNDNQTLPLNEKSLKCVGLFGPAANVLSLGDYSGGRGGWTGKGGVTPFQGLLNRLKGKAEVILHQPGSDVTALAKSCDVVIFFGAIYEGEGKDRSHLALPSAAVKANENSENVEIVDNAKQIDIHIDQEKMIEQLAASGIKTIVVLQNGSVIDIRNWVDKVDAILEAWYPGEQGGTAIAEALLGDINPGGRLPISWVRHVGQVPYYYSIKTSGRSYQYNDDDGKPMFPFGYGLSYTSFEYSGLMVPPKVKRNQNVEIKVTVKNTGKVRGDEVIQLYLRQEYASVVRPLKELKAFKRVTLDPGESKQVTLPIPYRSFGLWNKDMQFVIEPGNFDIQIGSDAENILLSATLPVE